MTAEPRQDPWTKLTTPNYGLNVLLHPASTHLDCYWAKNSEGRCVFLIELDEGDHSNMASGVRIPLRGVEVDLKQIRERHTQNLTLTLVRHVDRDIFASLCDALANSLAEVESSSVALEVAIQHLRRWKSFLSSGGKRILSPEEVRGLFAELQILRKLYQARLSPAAAVDAWKGPERLHNDFVFENLALEIKSLAGTDRNSVRISSEDQLDSTQDRLFLIIIGLSENEDSDHACSLNELVTSISDELAEYGVADEFGNRLALSGYLPIPEYDQPAFLVTTESGYIVADNFPRLTRTAIPEGLFGVRYQIRIEQLDGFSCDLATVWGS
ncbi:PD-(D/E)XK motif protein [Salinisphaera sp.]|uniref:PD-(D/E)XK motif protein n=1 Tax=Salinisphaera sp. TaxID=1914330 RepID=UPI000C3CEBDE|nr:PD-(D/E)XK motif protein [Salinisphaera sp.]MAS11202.1 hypothetical protein [Salinisphaera sp.]|tara:strand:- start:942 stop:1922 length:981 start_codon:yes stop_codon:yes gene_type:complete